MGINKSIPIRGRLTKEERRKLRRLIKLSQSKRPLQVARENENSKDRLSER